MKQAITIVTHPSNQIFLEDLVQDLKGYNKYKKYIVINKSKTIQEVHDDYYESLQNEFTLLFNGYDGYELGAIKIMMDKTDIDEFVLLQDTIRIKNTDIFDELFETYKDKSVCLSPRYLMYMGKYQRKILQQLNIPFIETKKDAVNYEYNWHNEYINKIGGKVDCIDDTFIDGNHKFVNYKGYTCMLLESVMYKKYKRVWNPSMIKEGE